MLGLRRLGWGREANRLHQAWKRGDIDMLRKAAPKIRRPRGLALAARLSPDGRVVPRGQVRPDPTHLGRRLVGVQAKPWRVHGVHGKIYGIEKDEDPMVKLGPFYENHLHNVREYFAGTDRMIELCWEEGDGWPELCGFIGVPGSRPPLPALEPRGIYPSDEGSVGGSQGAKAAAAGQMGRAGQVGLDRAQSSQVRRFPLTPSDAYPRVRGW